ncbi:hypothetical protein OO013_09560 [Mangrovivirga sp. M17]|uniref:Uncharacterized protein n=1 Tax=Mangrovivirga halotolerans TaxID=2993936 RepID=A0ABT3RS65_9BACT|nr:hypothetical protein [Mangrovivirga halotolerans]MCX2744112.1 hypothetical protein [Mangrovivirga halotolerans]
MEQSKNEIDKILELGKKIVSELELDGSTDTLSKWMAHYLSEKIYTIDELDGYEREEAKKECFDLIVKLWDRKWTVPPLKKEFDRFEKLFNVLERLDPKNDESFFIPVQIKFGLEDPNDKKNKNNIDYYKSVLKIDENAKDIINDLLKEIAKHFNLDPKIKDVIDLFDSYEAKVVTIVSNMNINESEDKNDPNMEIRNSVTEKIRNIEEFEKLLKEISDSYKKQLKELNKS